MTKPLCAICGEDHDYEHLGRHIGQFTPLEALYRTLPSDRRRAFARAWKAFAKSLYAQRALWEKQVDFALDVINAEERARQAEEKFAAERERGAGICDRLADVKEQGACPIGVVLQLREAARLVRGGSP